MKKKYRSYLILTILLLITLFLKPDSKVISQYIICDIYILNEKNDKIFLNIEIPRTHENMMKGLMFRNYLEENSGMLFVFKDEAIQNFWMKNTYIPLSIAFINQDGIINEIHDMRPLDTSILSSKKTALYALEVNKDWFKKNNITEGCRIIFNGCIGK